VLRCTKVLVIGGRVSTQLPLCCFMKRFALALGFLALGAPAMAGGIEGGVKNSYFTNFNTETVNYGERNIHVDSYSEVTWEGETESHKSFQDFMGKVTGVEGSYDLHESFDFEYDSKADKGHGHGHGHEGRGRGDGSKELEYSASQNLGVDFEDPKVQLTWSEGYTNTWMTAQGYDSVQTNVNIYEEYDGYSESTEHGHEATSFASAF
jgi:hypothetical protein